MIRLNGNEYDGYVADNGDETLTVILHTWEGFDDVANAMTGINTVESVTDGVTTAYHITSPISAKIVQPNLYSIVFSTKPSVMEAFEQSVKEIGETVERQSETIKEQTDTIQELSDTIDQLLVDSLEG